MIIFQMNPTKVNLEIQAILPVTSLQHWYLKLRYSPSPPFYILGFHQRLHLKKERQSKKFCKELESHGEVAFKVAHRKFGNVNVIFHFSTFSSQHQFNIRLIYKVNTQYVKNMCVCIYIYKYTSSEAENISSGTPLVEKQTCFYINDNNAFIKIANISCYTLSF